MKQSTLNGINRPRATIKPAEDVTWTEARQFFLDLRAWGEWKGFKTGYAAVQYKERFGVWPLRKWNEDQTAQNVGAETMAWIDGRRKEWMKEKKKARKIEEQARAETGSMSINSTIRDGKENRHNDWIDLADYRA